jgi:septum site-determining protein MinC
MSAAPQRIDLKSAQVATLQLALRTRSGPELAAQLQAAWGGLAGAFDGEPLSLDVSELPAGDTPCDWPALLQLLRGWSLVPVALTGAAQLSAADCQAAQAAGLAIAEASATAPVAPASPPAVATVAAPAPERHTVVLDRPLRSGQQFYARDADLVVLGLVSHGAEVIADGHIHVYGALRGRAIAGAKGRTDARIFAQSLEAELLAVAGTFRTSEKPLPPEVLAKPAQVRLEGERLVFEPLKF